jgi:hypothetical protein
VIADPRLVDPDDPSAPAPGLHLQDRIFLARVAIRSGCAEDDEPVKDHPLLVWCQKRLDEPGQYQAEDENLRQAIVGIWREWAEDNAADFAATLREYCELTQKAKRARRSNRQDP